MYLTVDGTKEIGAVKHLSHVVTAAEATAAVIVITINDLPSVEIYQSQVFRSGVKIVDGSTYTTSGSVLTITEDATTPTWAFTAGDVVMLVAAGRSVE